MLAHPGAPSLIDEAPIAEETTEWLNRARRLAPLLERHKEQAEQQRFMPRPVLDGLRDARIHRMFLAREFGGEQVGLQTASAVIQELACCDPSVGWQMSVQAAVSRFADYLPESTAHELFSGSGLVVGSLNPTGKAEDAGGGYWLSGVWPFASGFAHADWLVCGAVVTEDEQPRQTSAGPEIRVLFVPRSACRMLDTWHSLGLRGTGSDHFEVDKAFVPADYTIAFSDLQRPPPARASRGYAIGYFDSAPFGGASTALGIARGALAAFRELAAKKIPMGGSGTLAVSHTVQDKLARAEILVRSARLLLSDAAWHVMAYGEHGGDPLSALARLATATVAENTAAAVDLTFKLAGSSSVYSNNPLERYFRDIHSTVKHLTLSPTNIEMVGQYLLGGELLLRR